MTRMREIRQRISRPLRQTPWPLRASTCISAKRAFPGRHDHGRGENPAFQEGDGGDGGACEPACYSGPRGGRLSQQRNHVSILSIARSDCWSSAAGRLAARRRRHLPLGRKSSWRRTIRCSCPRGTRRRPDPVGRAGARRVEVRLNTEVVAVRAEGGRKIADLVRDDETMTITVDEIVTGNRPLAQCGGSRPGEAGVAYDADGIVWTIICEQPIRARLRSGRCLPQAQIRPHRRGLGPHRRPKRPVFSDARA